MGRSSYLQRETVRQQIRQGPFFIPIRGDHIDLEVLLAKLPHHLPAYAAGWEQPGDHAVLATTNGNGRKIPLAIIDGLENAVRSAQFVGL